MGHNVGRDMDWFGQNLDRDGLDRNPRSLGRDGLPVPNLHNGCHYESGHFYVELESFGIRTG